MRIFLPILLALGICFSAQALDRLPMGSPEEVNHYLLTEFTPSAVIQVRRHVTGSGAVDPVAGTAEPSKWTTLGSGRVRGVMEDGRLDFDLIREHLIDMAVSKLTDPNVDLGAHIFQTIIQIRIDGAERPERGIFQTSQIFQIKIGENGEVVIPDRAYVFNWSTPRSLIVRESGVLHTEVIFAAPNGHEFSMGHSTTSNSKGLKVYPDLDILVIPLRFRDEAEELGLPSWIVFTYVDGTTAEFDLITGERIGDSTSGFSSPSLWIRNDREGMRLVVMGADGRKVVIEATENFTVWEQVSVITNENETVELPLEPVAPLKYFRARVLSE